jgi:putative membrane protein
MAKMSLPDPIQAYHVTRSFGQTEVQHFTEVVIKRAPGPPFVTQFPAARTRLMQLSAFYPWLKALHVAFMVTWFAGLFYLPRLFIYHTEAKDELSRERFTLMERRLFAIMTIGAVLTGLFGFVMLYINQALLQQDWFLVKLLLLVGMVVYHLRCLRWIGRLAAGELPANSKWLRWFNELPTVFLLTIITLVIVRPF